MIVDIDEKGATEFEPEIIVIGSGPVGIVAAVAMARAGKRVLILECGGRTVEQRAQDLNEATVVGRPHGGVTEGRARILGGTSTLWGGQLIPFREIDFAQRPWLALKSWPIDRADVARYFVAVSTMLNLPIKEDSEDVIWSRLGIVKPDLGPDLPVIVTKWLKEPNLARLFGDDLAKNPNLKVFLHANVVGFENDGAKITGVNVQSPGGQSLVIRAPQVVLACGTIEACRLMLAAANTNPALPWAGNPWVGVGFQDHLDLRAGSVKPIDHQAFHDAFDNIFLKGYKFNPKITLSSRLQEQHGITNIAAVMTFESSLSENLNNVKIFLRSLRSGVIPPNARALPAHFAALARIWWPLIRRYVRDNRMFNPADKGISLRIHCEQKPVDSSRISLDFGHRDAFGQFRTKLDWRVDGSEIETLAVFCEKVATEMEARGLAHVTIDPGIVARDPAALAAALDTNHHCGGLRMATSSDEGVVDRDLKVFGTDNLYVAGAVVFPSSSFANPTFTGMALAARLADKLARGHYA
ncbi:MAG: GMC family oxidoreductase [Alphaproteobacteria bacterium]|nr:GMC family oxidoreductase [Alphaproteobacteria bacterium]